VGLFEELKELKELKGVKTALPVSVIYDVSCLRYYIYKSVVLTPFHSLTPLPP